MAVRVLILVAAADRADDTVVAAEATEGAWGAAGFGAVTAAVEAGDEEAFASALSSLLDAVRSRATPHYAESLDESDVILPMADATLAEVREMLEDDGLIPG